MRRSTKGLVLMIVYWTLMSIVMFYIAGYVLAAPPSMSDDRPTNTFDDCRGSPMPDDRGNGCTKGGLEPHVRM